MSKVQKNWEVHDKKKREGGIPVVVVVLGTNSSIWFLFIPQMKLSYWTSHIYEIKYSTTYEFQSPPDIPNDLKLNKIYPTIEGAYSIVQKKTPIIR